MGDSSGRAPDEKRLTAVEFADTGQAPAGDSIVSFTAKPSLIEAVGPDLLENGDPKAIAKASLAYVSRYLKAETGLVLLLDGERLVVQAASGPYLRRLSKSKFAVTAPLRELLSAGQTVINIRDAAHEPLLVVDLSDKLLELGFRSILMVAVSGRGLLVLADPRVDAFTSFDEAALGGVAAQLGFVFKRREREAELVRSAAGLQDLLRSISRPLSGAGSNEAMAATLATIITRSGADSGSFLLLDEGTGKLTLTAAIGLGPEVDKAEISMGEGIAGWVAAHRKPLSVTDLDGASGNGVDTTTVSALSVPISSGDDLIGVVNLGSTRRQFEFKMDDSEYLTELLARLGANSVVEQNHNLWQTRYLETIRALARLIESRNPCNIGHAAAVAEWAMRLAEALGLGPEKTQAIELAALLHDVGVAAFADDILGQEGPLSATERLIVRSHPVVGRNALADISYLQGILPMILHHHEHYDGSGYAAGLQGESIPVEARILAIAEAYVAMTSDRPHRPAISSAQALTEIKDAAGRQFDPKIVDTFGVLLSDDQVRAQSFKL